METAACMYCEIPATYSCSCVPEKVNLCKDHIIVHEDSIGAHNFNILLATKVPDLRVKNTLIEKINFAKKKAENNSALVMKKTSEAMRLLQTQASEVLKKFRKFIRICDEVIQEILTIETIYLRKIHTPLESALIGKNADHILSRIAAPVVKFFSPVRVVSLSHSIFPHFFYNYSDLSIGASVRNKIEVFPYGKRINSKKFELSGRMLNIGSNQLLFTGGNNAKKEANDTVFIFDIETEIVTELAPLNIPRVWHSMTWAEGNPAVIGGERSGNAINNVEIFVNNIWVEICPLNIARSSCTSICVQNIVWVIGGYFENYLDSIEKYFQGNWLLVDIKLAKPCGSVGLVSTGADLILFGGKTAYKKKNEDVHYFDTTSLRISELKKLKIRANFPFNQFFIASSFISALATDKNDKVSEVLYKTSKISIQ